MSLFQNLFNLITLPAQFRVFTFTGMPKPRFVFECDFTSMAGTGSGAEWDPSLPSGDLLALRELAGRAGSEHVLLRGWGASSGLQWCSGHCQSGNLGAYRTAVPFHPCNLGQTEHLKSENPRKLALGGTLESAVQLHSSY